MQFKSLKLVRQCNKHFTEEDPVKECVASYPLGESDCLEECCLDETVPHAHTKPLHLSSLLRGLQLLFPDPSLRPVIRAKSGPPISVPLSLIERRPQIRFETIISRSIAISPAAVDQPSQTRQTPPSSKAHLPRCPAESRFPRRPL